MVSANETALICDFAEIYHVYDYRSLPLQTAAALSFGLRDDSRIKIYMSGAKCSPDTMLKAVIADNVILIRWLMSSDGASGQNRPQSILSALLGESTEDSGSVMAFSSGDDFEACRMQIIQGGE